MGGEEGFIWKKPRFSDFGDSRGPYFVDFYSPSPDDISLKGMLPDRKPQDTSAGK